MESQRTRDLRDFAESWTLCQQCGTCHTRAPIIPHNWRELPPPEWSSPHRRCPSFEHFDFRAYTAQGRGLLASLLFDDEDFPVTDDLLKIVYSCTSCGSCSDVCRAVDPLTALWAMRQELVRRGAPLPEPLQRLHARIRKSGNIFGSTRPAKIAGLPTSGENVFFAGCTARFSQRPVIAAVAAVLGRAGIDVAYLADGEQCCGFVPGYDGAVDLMEEQAMHNVQALKRAGAKRVIVSCAHCYRALSRDYPLMMGDLPFEVVHFSQLVADLVEQGKIRFENAVEEEVTYHDPCFLGRHSEVYDPPRAVIDAMPSVRLNEMERSRRWSYCCGSGAKISSACFPKFGAAVTRERLEEGKRVAGTIVTACTTCVAQMTRGARQGDMDVRVLDLPVFVATRLGIDRGR